MAIVGLALLFWLFWDVYKWADQKDKEREAKRQEENIN